MTAADPSKLSMSAFLQICATKMPYLRITGLKTPYLPTLGLKTLYLQTLGQKRHNYIFFWLIYCILKMHNKNTVVSE